MAVIYNVLGVIYWVPVAFLLSQILNLGLLILIGSGVCLNFLDTFCVPCFLPISCQHLFYPSFFYSTCSLFVYLCIFLYFIYFSVFFQSLYCICPFPLHNPAVFQISSPASDSYSSVHPVVEGRLQRYCRGHFTNMWVGIY